MKLFSLLPCDFSYRILDFLGIEKKELINFESTCNMAKNYVKGYHIRNHNQSLPLLSLPAELFYNIFDFLGGEVHVLMSFECTCKTARASLRGYHIPQRVLLTPRLQSWLERTGALLGPNVTIPNRPVLALLVSEDNKSLITIENFDSELIISVWNIHSYKISRIVRGSMSVSDKDTFSEFHLLSKWRIVGLKYDGNSLRSKLELTSTLYVWNIHPSIGDGCVYYYQTPDIACGCVFSLCVDYFNDMIICVGGEMRVYNDDDLNEWKEWLILKDTQCNVKTINEDATLDFNMPMFQVVWSKRVDVPIKHVSRLRDGKILSYVSSMGLSEISFHFSLWGVQPCDSSLRLITLRSFSSTDICNYHVTCCLPMTTVAGYFATGHKNGEIYIWDYYENNSGNIGFFVHRLMNDAMIQKNGVSHMAQLPNGDIVSSGFRRDKTIKVYSERDGNIRKILIHSKCIIDFALLCEHGHDDNCLLSTMSNLRLVSAGEDRILNFTSMDNMRVKVRREENLPKFFSQKKLFDRSGGYNFRLG